MLRVILWTLVVLFAVRLLARLSAPRAAQAGRGEAEPDVSGQAARAQRPPLDAAERARLEAERGRALREGRQLDAIRIQRELGGFSSEDPSREPNAPGGR